MRLFNLLKNICVKLNLIADYVVEVGSEGDWTWQKWNSGIVKLSCVHNYDNYTLSCTEKYGYYYCTEQLSLALPFELVDYEKASAVASVTGAGVDFTARTRVATSSRVTFYWCNGNSYSVYGGPQVCVQVSGFWKSFAGGAIASYYFFRRWLYAIV